MRHQYFVTFLILAIFFLQPGTSNAQGSEHSVSANFIGKQYRTEKYQSTYNDIFASVEDKSNFKRLREYLQGRKDILQAIEQEYSSVMGELN